MGTSINIMEILMPIITAIGTALATILGTYLAKFLKLCLNWVESKIGATNYETAKEIAKGLYIYLEEKYNLTGTGMIKKAEMDKLLLEKFPHLTQVELDAINKEVWLSFNQEWKKYNTVGTEPKITTTETVRLDG